MTFSLIVPALLAGWNKLLPIDRPAPSTGRTNRRRNARLHRPVGNSVP